MLQKFLVLAVKTRETENAGAAQILSMAAGLVVLDTPFPAIKQEDQTGKPSFPSPNGRQEHIMRRLKEFGNKLNIEALWDSFVAKRQIQDQNLPIIWLYTLLAKDPSSASRVHTNAGTMKRRRS